MAQVSVLKGQYLNQFLFLEHCHEGEGGACWLESFMEEAALEVWEAGKALGKEPATLRDRHAPRLRQGAASPRIGRWAPPRTRPFLLTHLRCGPCPLAHLPGLPLPPGAAHLAMAPPHHSPYPPPGHWTALL